MLDPVCPARRRICESAAECGGRMQCAEMVRDGWVYAVPPAFVQELLTKGHRTAEEAIVADDGYRRRVWQRERWSEPRKSMEWFVYRYKD